MIKIHVDTEEQKERVIKSFEDSSTCPFLGGMCPTKKGCRYCIEENITRKIIDGQGEEWIINPHAGDKTKTN